MPTYDYECTACGHRFEAFQKMSDAPLTECPECKKKVKRLISAGLGIIFKGSGFYSTDSKKSSSAAISSKEKSPDVKTETASAETKASDSSKKDNTGKDGASGKGEKVTA